MNFQSESPPPMDIAVMDADSASIRSHRRSNEPAFHRAMTEAEEAELLSKATSQAMIAARSIMMSGGSEATALSTAKAAAQSILVPNTSEMEGSPYLGKMFLSKRKAKRQAEVVASMALLSVKQQSLNHHFMSQDQSHQQEVSAFMNSGNQRYSSGAPFLAYSPTMEVPISNIPPSVQVRNMSRTTSRLERNEMNIYMEGTISPRQIHNEAPTMTKIRSRAKNEWLRKRSFATGDQNKARGIPEFGKLPAKLPKAKANTKDLAKSVPEEDPIYCAGSGPRNETTVHSLSHYSSDSQTDGSETYGTETVESAGRTVDRSLAPEPSKGRFSNDDDPFMNAFGFFFCAPNEYSSETVASKEQKKRKKQRRRESRNDDGMVDSMRSSSESDEEPPRKPNTRRQPPIRHQRSKSTADSEQLLKELNLSSDEEEGRQTQTTSAPRNSIRESMEHAVFRALSAGEGGNLQMRSFRENANKSVSQGAPSSLDRFKFTVQQETNEKSPVSTSEVLSFTGSAANKTRLQALSQRVKFRRWMKKRKGQSNMTHNTNE